MTSVWLSSKAMTVQVDHDDDNVIIEAAPIVRKFRGQPMLALINWMRRQGGFKMVEL